MTHTQLTRTEISEFIETVLVRYGISIETFLKSDLDDFEEADVRELWLLYHDVLVEKIPA